MAFSLQVEEGLNRSTVCIEVKYGDSSDGGGHALAHVQRCITDSKSDRQIPGGIISVMTRSTSVHDLTHVNLGGGGGAVKTRASNVYTHLCGPRVCVKEMDRGKVAGHLSHMGDLLRR